jgi:uncharacterized protein YbaR (Trm112 family)
VRKIYSSSGFDEALHAERAVIFIFFDWSGQAAHSLRTLQEWERDLASGPAKVKFEIYQLAPDQHPFTWKWIADAVGHDKGGEHGYGSVVWLRKGTVAGFVHNAAMAGTKSLAQITHECFVLGKTGVSPESISAGRVPFDAGLLEILCCPETRQQLALAARSAVDLINRQIAGGRLKNRGGQAVSGKIDGGLIRSDGKYLYPLRQNIPILLVDEAIPLAGAQ